MVCIVCLLVGLGVAAGRGAGGLLHPIPAQKGVGRGKGR